jgi:hypothetical protein
LTEADIANLSADLAARLQLAGGTMTGALILNANPSTGLGAATKQYVDAETTRATTAEGTLLPKAGGTLTGALVLNADPATALGAATKQYVDAETTRATSAEALALPKGGGTMTGALVLNADPSTALGAATKQYVDAETTRATAAEAARLPLAGGQMTGTLGMNQAPTTSQIGMTVTTDNAGVYVTNTLAGGNTTGSALTGVSAAAAGLLLGSQVAGDTFKRFTQGVDGKASWGSGTAARDTNLYRSAAGVLATDTAFTAASLKASGGTGAASATRLVGANASGAPASGTWVQGDIAADYTGKLYICTAGGTPGTWTAISGGGSSGTAYSSIHPSDYGWKEWMFAPHEVSTSGNPPVAGTVHTMMMVAQAGGSYSNLVVYVITAGASLTSGQCFAALYTVSGGNLVRQAVSADCSSALMSAGAKTTLAIPFTSSATIAAGTQVFAALLVNGTTMPQLGRSGATSSADPANMGLTTTTGFRYGIIGTGQTNTLASVPVGTQTTSGAVSLWCALS